ncbi:L-lysine 2-3-aminomutase [Penicillium sp. DV-2018c]|nr:L-lysine 2-3-aminomutase [Penicillium sp. DV-2018c]
MGAQLHFIFFNYLLNIILLTSIPCTYDHRVWKTGLPVRSAVLKPHAGELVVGWVTTSESSLLYVFVFAGYSFF